MGTKQVVDTHALVWHLEGNPRLGSSAKVIMYRAETAPDHRRATTP